MLGLTLLGGAGPVAATGDAAAPAAHAKLTGSEPADGQTVDTAPDAVTLMVDAKPATTEGDPLRVYGPDGQRLDDGRTSVGDNGHTITVGLLQGVDRPSGHYEIVYRIVSADTHLIAGRLQFTAREAASPLAALTGAAGTSGAGVRGPAPPQLARGCAAAARRSRGDDGPGDPARVAPPSRRASARPAPDAP